MTRSSPPDEQSITPAWGAFTGATSPSGAAARFQWLQRWALHACGPIGRIAGPQDRHAFGVLMYHRVTPITDPRDPPTLNVRPDQFRNQLLGLLRRGHQPVRLSEALDRSRSGAPLPAKAFVVTFDDGFENNCTEAWPILRELGVPATIFLATAYLDRETPFPFDNWALAGVAAPPSSWRPLKTDQCRQMLGDPLIDFGAHTHTHQDFRGRPLEFESDLRTNVGILADDLGIDPPAFAFPQGRKKPGFVSPELVKAAQRAGVSCALTTENDLVQPRDDPYDWGRLSVEDRDTSATIAARLDGWYGAARNLFRRLAKTSRRTNR